MDTGGKKQVGCDGLADVNMPGNEETDTKRQYIRGVFVSGVADEAADVSLA